VVTDHPLARGVAQLHGLQAESAASTPLASGAGQVLWIVDDAQPKPEQLEQDYFAPLLAMLRRGELSQLVLELPGQGRWLVDRAALRRWWRRCKPLSALLKGG